MSDYKTVLMPIRVPDNDYCWNGKIPCEHFDNYGGHGTCVLGMDPDHDRKTGLYPKPEECASLALRVK